jgi:molybdopterin/thiamine biosynthesis adenylyltransferase
MRCNTFLTVSEFNRYNRQMRLSEVGKEGQEKIKGSSVLVIGAGALGSPVLQVFYCGDGIKSSAEFKSYFSFCLCSLRNKLRGQ